jgi:hypothetical protein
VDCTGLDSDGTGLDWSAPGPLATLHFPSIVGVCVYIQSGAEVDDRDGEGHVDDSDGDGVSDGDYSTRST